MYYRGHPKVNDFFYSLIFTLNHRRPKMSKFDTSDKKIIETIFFKCHISLRFRQLGLLQSQKQIGLWLLWPENYIAVRLASSI
jgi:hypothetical protein